MISKTFGPKHNKRRKIKCKNCGRAAYVADDGYGRYPKEINKCILCLLKEEKPVKTTTTTADFAKLALKTSESGLELTEELELNLGDWNKSLVAKVARHVIDLRKLQHISMEFFNNNSLKGGDNG